MRLGPPNGKFRLYKKWISDNKWKSDKIIEQHVCCLLLAAEVSCMKGKLPSVIKTALITCTRLHVRRLYSWTRSKALTLLGPDPKTVRASGLTQHRWSNNTNYSRPQESLRCGAVVEELVQHRTNSDSGLRHRLTEDIWPERTLSLPPSPLVSCLSSLLTVQPNLQKENWTLPVAEIKDHRRIPATPF